MTPALQARLEFLEATQGPDGGWGYFPGKISWLEPTAWATLALHHAGGRYAEAAGRGWRLLRSWQLDDGAFPAAGVTGEPHWATALMVTLFVVRGETGDGFRRAVAWLLDTGGAEASVPMRMLSMVRPSPVGHDLRFRGWPWKPGTSSWIEPTAHALVALKKAAPHVKGERLMARVQRGERMILARQAQGGGWNYGAKSALGVELPVYPETTGVALVGLEGVDRVRTGPALRLASQWLGAAESRLAGAWLRIALRLHGDDPPDAGEPPPDDVLVTALEAIAAPGGAHALLRARG